MQFIDLKAQYQRIKPEVDAAVLKAMDDGKYIMGDEVKTLETRLAEFVGRKYCLCCSNGTDALTLSFLSLGVGRGDAVFVPSFTFFASAETVAVVGATPVFVDIDPETYNISAKDLEEKINKVKAEGKLTPKAIVAVDLFGQTADYDAVLKVAKEYGLFVVEDGAQGFGGSLNGVRCGKFGDISTTSFFPAKPLGCYGDGGAVFTDDDDLYELLKSYRVHGSSGDKYNNVRIGLNARLDTLQAAILHCKLDIFEDELVARNRVADRYTKNLSGKVVTPKVLDGGFSSWAQYTIRVDASRRAEIMDKMKQSGIPTMIYYGRPMHLQKAFESLGGKQGDIIESEKASNCVMSLPMHPYLTDEQVDEICQKLIEIL
ncbi:MAG: DegT/DnrJ/EryC1/StrS aminotransferase family protein [Clostridia bacterium]|nr:DegT/DnrJ/EryC1/StrS aminotransferase family protein [Clostridia bacterium]